MSGRVRVGAGDGARLDRKPGDMVDPGTVLELVSAAPFVSRGGEKLSGALDAFGVDPAGPVCLDVGASTGGFTDCLLQRGAARVYALDVGRGQLAESLRTDTRVVSMERTHAARLDPDAADRLTLPEAVSLTVADVSFISLTRLLRGMAAATSPGGDILPMVKPQFELTPREVPGGVVRDPALRAAAVARVREHALDAGLDVLGEVESSLVGPSGNHEWFLWLQVPPGSILRGGVASHVVGVAR
jgi:23S rRNA (cytidine1920-2'-O)/16S rRNA (cytidine1409-2'-O)-methyltransferase